MCCTPADKTSRPLGDHDQSPSVTSRIKKQQWLCGLKIFSRSDDNNSQLIYSSPHPKQRAAPLLLPLPAYLPSKRARWARFRAPLRGHCPRAGRRRRRPGRRPPARPSPPPAGRRRGAATAGGAAAAAAAAAGGVRRRRAWRHSGPRRRRSDGGGEPRRSGSRTVASTHGAFFCCFISGGGDAAGSGMSWC